MSGGDGWQAVLNLCTLLGAAAGFVGLWVSWRSLRASIRAEKAAHTADEVASFIRTGMELRAAREALEGLVRQSQLLCAALGDSNLRLTDHLVRQISGGIVTWGERYARLVGGRAVSAGVEGLRSLSWDLASLEDDPNRSEQARDAALAIYEKLSGLLGTVSGSAAIRGRGDW